MNETNRCAVDGCEAQGWATIDLGAGITIRACIEHTDHLVTVSRRSAAAYLAERTATERAAGVVRS